ncbi:hypothetical protein BDN67DRAFT_984019 [Paxillus ammoniavirescens]|nr:hypothetical protein BDN67DRAFT_984019 [Paxillus ammoniavirescens]
MSGLKWTRDHTLREQYKVNLISLKGATQHTYKMVMREWYKDESLVQHMSALSLENTHHNTYHSPEDDIRMEEVARGVFKITLEDDGLWKRDTEGAPGYIHSAPPAVHSSAAKEGSLLAPHEGVEETFGALLLIDHEMYVQVKNVTKLVDQLVVAGAQGEVWEALEGEGKWLRNKLDKITHLNTREDEANAVLLHELAGI